MNTIIDDDGIIHNVIEIPKSSCTNGYVFMKVFPNVYEDFNKIVKEYGTQALYNGGSIW